MKLIEFIQANPELVEKARKRAELEFFGRESVTIEQATSMVGFAYLGGYRDGMEGRDGSLPDEVKEV